MADEVLLKIINEKKIKMIEVAKKKGMTSLETLKISNELDILIIRYQRNHYKK